MIKKVLVGALVVAFNVTAAFAADDLAAIKATVQKHLKDIPVDSVKTTPIDGLYEIDSHFDVFYFHPKAELFVLGNIHHADGKSLTLSARDQIVEKTIASLDLTKAIKTGSGKNVVIEFIDPDGAIDRAIWEFWKTKSGLTRYTFLFPPAKEGPEASKIAVWILSQKDKTTALEKVLAGQHDQNIPAGETEEGKKLFQEHLKFADKAFASVTPQVFVNNKVFLRPDYASFNDALGEKEEQGEEQPQVESK